MNNLEFVINIRYSKFFPYHPMFWTVLVLIQYSTTLPLVILNFFVGPNLSQLRNLHR